MSQNLHTAAAYGRFSFIENQQRLYQRGSDFGLHSQQEVDQVHGDPLNAYRTLL